MVISQLEKYVQILYQKIALRVWVPTQQTVRDFEFSSPSYACFTKMCLAGRGALDMSNRASRHIEIPSGRIKISYFCTKGYWTCRRGHLDMSKCPRAESKFLVFGQRGIGHVERGNWTCRKGPGLSPFTLFHI